MTSPISAISSLLSSSALGATTGIAGTGATAGTTATTGTQATGGSAFASVLASSVDQLQATQTNADNLATQAATGNLQDVHDYMIASNEASLATEMTVAIKNQAVSAFNEIMRMQV